MKDLYKKNPRLSQLLDQLCEQTLDQEGADEISSLVKNDSDARDYYVRYLEIHTSLYWDIALPVVNSSDASNEIQQPTGLDSRLQQLVDRLVCDATLDSTALLSNQIHDDASRGSDAVVRDGKTTFSRNWKYRLTGGVSLLALMLFGFWVVQNRPQLQQEQIAQQAATDGSLVEEKTVINTTPSDHETVKPQSKDDLPPRLPDIKWHGNPLVHSNSPLPNDNSSENDTPIVNDNPALTDDDKIVSAINDRIHQGWVDQSLSPSPIAEDHEWVRRVYLDLSGRIPTSREVKLFVNDKRSGRERRLVDQLIESPEFSMHWSTRWKNLLVGRSPNARVDRFALQKYLRDAIAKDRPWSVIVSELISAQGDPRKNGAANFLVAHLNNQAVPATAFVARTLLGTQIHCAQCHKHPSYETTQLQFWELNSFFKQAKVIRNEGDNKTKASYYLTDKPIGGPTFYETRSGLMRVAYPSFNGHKVSDDKLVSRRKELADLLFEKGNPFVAKAFVNRTWSHFFGHAFTQPVDDLGPHNPPTHPELFETLSQSFVACDYDIKRLVRWICLSKPYRLSSRSIPGNQQDAPDHGEPPAFSRMYFKPLTAEQLYDSLVAVSGSSPQTDQNWEKHIRLRESWSLQFVNALNNDENGESEHFQGTITQALVMMNGDLMNQTISLDSKRLASVRTDASVSDLDKFEAVCLSILSRKPRLEEIALFRKLTRQLRDANSPTERKQMLAGSLEDVMWAYLNSSEFIVNH